MGMIESLQEFVGQNISLLLPVDEAWQPTDFLPDFTGEDWAEKVTQFRNSSQGLSNELLVVLVGNMITEEALPSYTVSLEQVVHDPTGTSDTPWATWLRGWTAEENRHGDLLNAYLRLTGRVDIRSVETTIHHLIRNGFYWGRRDHEFAGLIYAASGGATRISHGKVAKLAAAQGDDNLARICRTIAADETRHETFYTRVIGEIMERDPAEGVIAYKNVLKGLVAMPGSLMSDGKDPSFVRRLRRCHAAHWSLYTIGLRRNHRPPEQGLGRRPSYAVRQGGQGTGLHLQAARALCAVDQPDRRSDRRTTPGSIFLGPRRGGMSSPKKRLPDDRRG